MAGGRIPLPGKKPSTGAWTLPAGRAHRSLAALDGVVTAARRGPAYGNYVRLTHGDGQETLYAHMQYLYVRAGEVVAAGQRLALPDRRAVPPGHTCTLNF